MGIILLIIGIIALGFGAAAYSHFSYNQRQITNGNALNNATNQALVSAQLGGAIGGFIGGVIFFVIGLVLMIVGFKGKNKKEKLAERK
ncbi:MAG: hypothetical protein AMDU1_APLC00030G0001 [Thermoplasmatales archaeon A-plasma]|nr:MAG: hypothetical protein AMDU1_APLC00030G0001 [Thermoplasmatales archaeon A-plasma]